MPRTYRKQYRERALGCCTCQEGDTRAVPLLAFFWPPLRTHAQARAYAIGGRLRPPAPWARYTLPVDVRTVEEVVERLHRVDRFDWVGVYLVEGDVLVLGPYRGEFPAGHDRIPMGQGVCGAVAERGETEVVPDVSRREGHIQCFLGTRSEAVAPIVREGRVVGVLDVDSDTLDAFGEAEVRLIEEAAAEIARGG